MRAIASDGWYARNRVLIWICVLISVNQLGFGAIVPVVPFYARSFGVPQSAIGLSIGLYGLARFLINVPAGTLADRIGRRGTLALGGVVTSCGNLLCALAPGYARVSGSTLHRGRRRGTDAHRSANHPGGYQHARAARADHGDVLRRVRLRGWHRSLSRWLAGGALGPTRALLRLHHSGVGGAALGWFRVPETRGLRSAVSSPSPLRRIPSRRNCDCSSGRPVLR